MDRLNVLDARFLDAEDQDPHASLAIASLAVFEGPAPSFTDFREAIAARLHLVPRYRQKVRTVPFRLGPPVWVDDASFDIGFHVRRTALPAPGGDAELAALMGRVMSQRLDRDRPLWEYWFVEGLEDGRWALVSKVHHCMVDGVSGTDMYRVLLDLTPEPTPIPEAGAWEPARIPNRARLATGGLAELAAMPVQAAAAVVGGLSHPRQLGDRARTAGAGLAHLTAALRPAPRSSLVGSIGRQRRYAWVRQDLGDVLTTRTALGGTVNDVVLTAIAGGFRELLLSRGEEPARHMVPTLVPVNVRAPGEESIRDNRVSALLPHLPVEVVDDVDRLHAIRREIAELKAGHESEAGEALVALGRFVPFGLASRAARAALALPQREVVTVTTNVPGPRTPLYALGRQLIEMTPYVPIATRLRTGVAIITYCDRLTIGLTGDYDTTSDLGVLARGIEESFARLAKAAAAAS